MGDMPYVPREAILEGKVVVFTTLYPDDDDMCKRFGLITRHYVKKCLVCGTEENVVAAGLWNPEHPVFLDSSTTKQMVYGYALCIQHVEEVENDDEEGEGVLEEVERKISQIMFNETTNESKN